MKLNENLIKYLLLNVLQANKRLSCQVQVYDSYESYYA